MNFLCIFWAFIHAFLPESSRQHTNAGNTISSRQSKIALMTRQVRCGEDCERTFSVETSNFEWDLKWLIWFNWREFTYRIDSTGIASGRRILLDIEGRCLPWKYWTSSIRLAVPLTNKHVLQPHYPNRNVPNVKPRVIRWVDRLLVSTKTTMHELTFWWSSTIEFERIWQRHSENQFAVNYNAPFTIVWGKRRLTSVGI